MGKITAKYLFDTFCERFAALDHGIKLFPTSLIIEFVNGSSIIFYHQESEWIKMSSATIENYYSRNIDYNYSYEQTAIIVDIGYDHNSINFEDLKNQFNEIQNSTGFSYVNTVPVGAEGSLQVIALTHFEHLALQTLNDYENLVFNHTLNSILNSYTQYQKAVFSKFRLDEKIHTFVLRWWESDISYNLNYQTEQNAQLNFERVLNVENDIEIMLAHTGEDQKAFFSIWLILYKVCIRLKDALADHPIFASNFKCYPTLFDHFQWNKEYSNFAEKYKNLDTDKYALEQEWRSWIGIKNITPENPDAHFYAFCKRREITARRV